MRAILQYCLCTNLLFLSHARAFEKSRDEKIKRWIVKNRRSLLFFGAPEWHKWAACRGYYRLANLGNNVNNVAS